MGAGGIGGIVAATLTEVGSAITAVSTNAAIRAAVDKSGFRIVDEGEERVVRGWVSPAPEGRYDLCILATQPPNVEEAARTQKKVSEVLLASGSPPVATTSAWPGKTSETGTPSANSFFRRMVTGTSSSRISVGAGYCTPPPAGARPQK